MTQLHKASILIVDDKPLNIDLLRDYLNSDQYKISAVTSGEQAIKVLNKVNVDLILMDVMMPVLDGFQTCKAIKGNLKTKHIPIIFVTAKIAPEDVSYGFDVGAADYILKPVHRDVLLARVENQLSRIKKELLEQQLKEANKLAELGSMVASITHEVATPMANMLLASSVIEQETTKIKSLFAQQKMSKSDFTNYLSMIEQSVTLCHRNATRATDLMDSFKQVAVDQCSKRLLSFNLAHYIADILLTISPKLSQHNIEITANIEKHISLTTYPGALSQVIINIINNALVHAFPNQQTGVINLCAQADQNIITITIVDNGQGMSEQQQQQAFVKYYTTKANDGGSGLGLAICQELVENDLQGKISLSSEVKIGTTITLELNQKIHQPVTPDPD